MIFATENAVADILSGKKTQTRRLVKEGDFTEKFHALIDKTVHTPKIKSICYWGRREPKSEDDSTARIKWQVGRDYAVQIGRGKHTELACPKCKWKPTKDTYIPFGLLFLCIKAKVHIPCPKCGIEIKPLRIRLTGIRKERLLDISETDAKKEGFENRHFFLEAFYKINKLIPQDKALVNLLLYGPRYNPFVWVLGFVVK